MAATDFKITDAEIAAVHVEAQPDVLQGSAQQNKKVFDAYCDKLAEKHNGLCDHVADNTDTVIHRDVLTFYESLGWTPPNS